MRDPCCCFERAQHLRGPWCVRSDRHPISAATGYLVDVRGHRRPCWCWAGTSCDVWKLEHGRAFAGWKLGLGAFNVSCLFILKRECIYCQGVTGGAGRRRCKRRRISNYAASQHLPLFFPDAIQRTPALSGVYTQSPATKPQAAGCAQKVWRAFDSLPNYAGIKYKLW